MLIKEGKSKQRFIQKAFLSLSLPLSLSLTLSLLFEDLYSEYLRTSYAAFDPHHKVLFNLPISCNVGREYEDPVFLDIMGTRYLVHSDSLDIQSQVSPLKIYETLLTLCTNVSQYPVSPTVRKRK